MQVEVFNGEIGTVGTIGFDSKVCTTLKTGYGPRLKRFSVKFSRKPGLTVGYGADVPHGGTKYKLTESVEGDLELAYAVSVQKAQGSEFAHTFVVVPASGIRPVSAELIYTALTRANRHCTLLIERDINSLLDARRRENAQTPQINSSLFELHVAKAAFQGRGGWYEAGKIHEQHNGILIEFNRAALTATLFGIDVTQVANTNDDRQLEMIMPLTQRRRGRQMKLRIDGTSPPNLDKPLITAIVRAWDWANQFVSSKASTMTEICEAEGFSDTYVGQLLPLAFVAPSDVEHILNGYQSPDLSADRLIWAHDVPLTWTRVVA